MAGKVFENIPNHVEQALARLPQQYKDAPSGGWDKLIEAFVKPAQTLEDLMQDMLEQRGLTTSVGVNLDRLGQWVGEPRLGRTDADYLLGIYGKISENNSDGTAKDIILSLKRFVTADKYEYLDTTNGKFKIVLTNPVYPVDPRLYGSIDATKCAGVGYVEFTTTPDDYFGFANDPDAKGFSEYTPIWLPFSLVDEALTPSEEVGVYESGGDYTLKLAMKDGVDALSTANQVEADYEESTDGSMRIFDAEGVIWDIISSSLTTLTQNATLTITENTTGSPYTTNIPVADLGQDTDLYGFTATLSTLVRQIALLRYVTGGNNDTKAVGKLWRIVGANAVLISTSRVSDILPQGTGTLYLTFDTPVKISVGDIILFSVHITEGTDTLDLGASTSITNMKKYGVVDGETGTSITPVAMSAGVMSAWYTYAASAETRTMELALTSSAGATEHCAIYRNGVVVSMADFLTLFAPLNRTASPVFNQPLIVRSYIDDNSQAGHYGTLLLKP